MSIFFHSCLSVDNRLLAGERRKAVSGKGIPAGKGGSNCRGVDASWEWRLKKFVRIGHKQKRDVSEGKWKLTQVRLE